MADNIKMTNEGTQFSDGSISLAWGTGRDASEIIAVPSADRSGALLRAIAAGVVVETADEVTPVATPATTTRLPTYVQDTDPGAVGTGQLWSDTSGGQPVLKIRNHANSGWSAV